MSVELLHGDCLALLRTLPSDSLDSCVTDPPYGLEFMGAEWDAPWQASSKSALFGKRGKAMPGFGLDCAKPCSRDGAALPLVAA